MALILQALDNGYYYGFDIMDVTGLPSGTVYPALRRMESPTSFDQSGRKNRSPNAISAPLANTTN